MTIDFTDQPVQINMTDRLIFLFTILLFLFNVFIFHRYSTDDAFISYRYAANLSEGHGLTYNSGEPAVEGYSNLLWILILSLAYKVKLPLPETGAFLGVIFGILTIFLMSFHAYRQRYFKPNISVGLPALIMALCPAMGLWASTGMETLFFTFLLLFTWVMIAIENRRNIKGFYSGISLAMLVLTRPEGIAFALALVILPVFLSHRMRKNRLQFIPRLIFTLAAFIGQIFFRLLIYNSWLPNTFYAKTNSIQTQLPLGMDYVQNFLITGGGFLLLLTVLCLFVHPKIEGVWSVLLISIAFTTYVLCIGGDWMPGFRFFVPIIPFLAFPASLLLSKFGTVNRPLFYFLSIALILNIFIGQGLFINQQLGGLITDQLKGKPQPPDVLKELGLHLKEVADPYAIVATVPAGKIAFYSGLKIIDMRGLNDSHIAHSDQRDNQMNLPGHMRGDPDYILSLKPDYIVTSGAVLKKSAAADIQLGSPMNQLDSWSITEHPYFQKCYKRVEVPLPSGRKNLLYFRNECQE